MRTITPEYSVISSRPVGLATSEVLKKTYFLLSLTILFSAVTALLPMLGLLPIMLNPLISIVGMFGLLFAAQATSRSQWGIFWTFAFTGFMGYTLAPTLIYYLSFYTNGAALIWVALLATAITFAALSIYAAFSKEDFSYLGGMLFVGITIALLLSIMGFFLRVEWFSVLVSGLFLLIVSGLVLLRTNMIVNGGEDNYVLATIGLYVSILNMFLSILQILGFLSGSRRS